MRNIVCGACLHVREVAVGARIPNGARCRSCAARGLPLRKRIPEPDQVRECPVCQRGYVGRSDKAACSPACTATLRRDAEHFDGHRSETVGLAERTCQLCGKTVPRKAPLHSHHVFAASRGRHDVLHALCAGCHQAVSALALRTRWGAQEFARLVQYAVQQRAGLAFEVEVEIREAS